MAKRTNYKQEKRRKEIEKQKKNEAKKGRKIIVEKHNDEHKEISGNKEEL